MWMVDTRVLCDQHLLGEHVEHHMFVGTINRGYDIWGYVQNNLVEPMKLQERHDALVKEMERRGMNHKSPLPRVNYNVLLKKEREAKVNVDDSLMDLIGRCEICKARAKRYGVI